MGVKMLLDTAGLGYDLLWAAVSTIMNIWVA